MSNNDFDHLGYARDLIGVATIDIGAAYGIQAECAEIDCAIGDSESQARKMALDSGLRALVGQLHHAEDQVTDAALKLLALLIDPQFRCHYQELMSTQSDDLRRIWEWIMDRDGGNGGGGGGEDEDDGPIPDPEPDPGAEIISPVVELKSVR